MDDAGHFRHSVRVADHWAKVERDRGYLRVRLRLAATAEGGRKGPIFSEYRAAWDIGTTFEGKWALCDAPLTFDGVDALHSGHEAIARLHPAHPEFWTEVSVGQEIHAHEGVRRIGTGIVLEIVPPSFA